MKKVLLILSLPVFLCSSMPPDLFSLGIGSFDFYRAKYRTWEFEAEYKFCVKWMKSPFWFLTLRPLLGIMATAQASGYTYLGLNFDLLFWDHLHIAPGFAAGYYWRGSGKNLGFPLEFRSSIELGWKFEDWHRIGLRFFHLSNASLGSRNPGEESLVLFYDVPIVKGFPFIRQKVECRSQN